MSTTPIKSAKVRNAVKTALGAAVAVPLMFGALPASAATGQIGDTTFDLSGYIKFDALYSLEGAGSTSGVMADDAKDLIGTSHNEGHFGTTVNQTRLRLGTDTATQFGNVHGYIEMDFTPPGFGGGHLRKRLAYVQWNGWTIGRIWSSFTDFNYGTTLNFGGPEAQIGQRVEGVRYTVDMGDAGAFDVSLENGSTASISNTGTSIVGGTPVLDGAGAPVIVDGAPVVVGGEAVTVVNGTTTRVSAQHKLPNLAMRYRGSVGSLSYQAAGIVRYNKFNIGNTTDSKIGWGLDVGGTYALASTGTSLSLSASYGAGIDEQGYGYTLLPATNYVDANGDVKNNKFMGVIASVGQKITDNLSTNFLYSWSRVKFGPTNQKIDGRTLAVNLMYSPVKPLVFGIEYSRAYASVDHGGSADANVVQFSTIYNF